MNIFEYISAMKALGTPVATAGIIILALFLVFIVFKALGGMFRGIWRQTVRTGMTLVSAVLAFVGTKIASDKIHEFFDHSTLDELISQIEVGAPEAGAVLKNVLSVVDPTILEYIVLLPATLILLPLVATALFFIINLVLKVVRAIVIKILGLPRGHSSPERLGGAALSIVDGIIWLVMITLPLTAALSLADATFEKALSTDAGRENTAIVEIYDDYVAPITKNPAIVIINKAGGNYVANELATVKFDGENTNLREEILAVAHIVLVDATSLKGANFTELTESDKAAITSIVDTLADSPYMSRILVGIIHLIPTAYETNFANNSSFDENVQSVLNSFMSFLKSVSRETLKEDLTTIKNFYFGFNDSGLIAAIKDGADLIDFINQDYRGEKHILGMLNSLSGNPRTKGIVDGMYDLVLNAAFSAGNSSADGSGEKFEIKVEDVKTGLNNIIAVDKNNYETVEEYKEALSNTITDTINDTVGVELEKETADEIANFVDENFSEKLDELTDKEFNELMFEVIDIYQSMQNGGEVNPDDYDNIFGEDGILGDDIIIDGEKFPVDQLPQ